MKYYKDKITAFLSLEKNAILILKVAAFLLFAGRAFQYFFWDAPYREIFWNEKIMTPLLNMLNISWENWSLYSDAKIRIFIKGLGVLYGVSAVGCLRVKKAKSIWGGILALGGINLVLMVYLYYRANLANATILFELTIQWITPFLLLAALTHSKSKALLIILKLSIAFTFIGHGCYAIGLFGVPKNFVFMVLNLTPISSYDGAVLFLKTVGILDFIVSVGIFIPKINLPFLGYTVIWGLLTALARVTAFFDFNRMGESLSRWGHETIFRLPHGLIPLACLILVLSQIEEKRINTRK